MPNANTITSITSTRAPAVSAPEGAAGGWVVEVIMPERPLDRRFFAVGTVLAADAEEAVLLYPGVLRSDQRIAKRRLSSVELSYLKLRIAAVRPYGWILHEADGFEVESNINPGAVRLRLALQLPFLEGSESMGDHDSGSDDWWRVG